MSTEETTKKTAKGRMITVWTVATINDGELDDLLVATSAAESFAEFNRHTDGAYADETDPVAAYALDQEAGDKRWSNHHLEHSFRVHTIRLDRPDALA